MRFITSEPVPSAHMMGTRPMKAALTVISLGRTRLTAPCITASSRSLAVFSRPCFFMSS